jgi:hypothetical protein
LWWLCDGDGSGSSDDGSGGSGSSDGGSGGGGVVLGSCGSVSGVPSVCYFTLCVKPVTVQFFMDIFFSSPYNSYGLADW